MPHRPKTTDGTAASRSMTVTIGAAQPARRELGEEQRDADADTGTAMISAISETTSGAVDERQRAELLPGSDPSRR